MPIPASIRMLLRASILPAILAFAAPASADLHAVGHEFRPTVEERTPTDPCRAGDGSTAALVFVCNDPTPDSNCPYPPLGKLYAEWRSPGGELLGEPVFVAEGHYQSGLPYACAPDGAVGVLLEYEHLRVFDRDGARGAAAPEACDLPYCPVSYAVASTQDGFLVSFSLYGSGLFGRLHDANGQASGPSFLLDGPVSQQSSHLTGVPLDTGDTLLAWFNWPVSIRAAILRSDGTVVPAVTVNEFPWFDVPFSLVLHVESPGEFVIAWENRAHLAGWVARRLGDGQNVPTTTTSTTTTTLDATTAFLPAIELATPPFGSNQFTIERPDIAGDDEGRWLAKWLDRIQTDDGYVAGAFASQSFDDARQWSAKEPFHARVDSRLEASRIEGNGGGVVLDVFVQDGWEDGYALFSRRSEDGGQSWSEEAPIFTSELGGYEYDSEIANLNLVSSTSGQWVAAWTEYVNYHAPCPYDENDPDPDCIDWVDETVVCATRFSLSADDGLTWSAPQNIVEGACSQVSSLQIATDGGDDWVAVWSDWVEDAIQIVVSSDGTETWSEPRTLVADVRTDDSALALATNDNGRWLLAYSRMLFDEAEGWPYGQYWRIFVTGTDDPEGDWSEPEGVAPWHTNVDGRDLFPSLDANEDDTFGLAWATHSSGAGLDADIVAAFSDDGGESWSLPHPVDTLAKTDSRTDFGPHILANGPVWAVAWRTIENNSAYSVRFARTRGDCGNGAVDAAEDCDDANLVEGDGCDTTCLFTGCGSQIVTGDEECDDGDADESDDCIACQMAFCGDGYVEAGIEECDDANGVDADECLNACTLARCGDGVTLPGAEACDDGDATGNNDTCLNACEPSDCGDGYLRLGKEQCDDGNTVNDDGCTRRCKLETDCLFFTNDGWRIRASDALKVLKRAVGASTPCPLRDCDVNRDDKLSATDALWTLRSAIGIFAEGCSLPGRLVLRVTSGEKFGALQVRIDYSDAAGHVEEKSGGGPACTVTASADIQSMNWQEEDGVVRLGLVSLPGIQGPAELMSCEWDPVSGPSLHDFRVTVEDATDTNTQTLNPPPVVTLTAE